MMVPHKPPPSSWREPLRREWHFSWPFAVFTLLMLLTSLGGLYLLSAGRSVAALEGHWSAESKTAVVRLLDYNTRGQESTWVNFRRTMVALGGASRVLPSLQQTPADAVGARRHLLNFGLPQHEIAPVLFFMQHLGWLPGVQPVLDQWQEASSAVRRLEPLGDAVRAEISAGGRDTALRRELADRIMMLDSRLDGLSDDLSQALQTLVSGIADTVFWTIVIQFVLLVSLGGIMAQRLIFGVVNGAREVRRQEERWRFAIEGANDALWEIDLETQQIRLSRRWYTQLGYEEPVQDFTLRPRAEVTAMIHPEDRERVRRRQAQLLSGQERMVEYRYRHLDQRGRYVWLQARVQSIEFDPQERPVYLLGVHTHVHERHLMEEKMRHMAWVDPLTGLPNRAGFQRSLRLALDNPISRQELAGMTLLPGGDDDSVQVEGECAVVVLNLDGFKDVNEEHGRRTGDAVLRSVAVLLENALQPEELLARTAGDGFSLLLRLDAATLPPGDSARAALDRRVQRLLWQVARPFEIDELPIVVQASAGSALYPADGADAEVLQAHAEMALLLAKAQARGHHRAYDARIEQRARERRVLGADLRLALDRHEFYLVYQPIVHQRTQRVDKAEVLLRWKHPQRGLVSPAEFIPVAEETGLILPIGEWILQQVDRDLHRLRAALGDAFQVSVNKSPRQFLHDAALQQPRESGLLKEHQGHNLCVEITESMLMEASAAVKDKFMQLRDLGIQVSLDDFGTGYSSLAYLKVFDIDFIKIDRSFVKNLSVGSSDQALCEAMVVMAHKLGMKVIAEGVETAVQRDVLDGAGCDYIQGYLYSPPKPLDEFLQWAARHAGQDDAGVARRPVSSDVG
ncbi:putative bifunctional diguanylate cyclase/phosphodiesterase [Amphibiibacter pelophylacis]|uniref:EAL domain-containing protein n=1 Tax=Amphibiibacter pelophylacis TaxID=1799477 RepID=A0ACC6P3E3_9BURK